MPKKITIKQIAELAGVSPGTVDRVLHNRGKVSAENLETITKILEDIGYKANIHASAIALKKSFSIVLLIPGITPGDFWEGIVKGFESGIREYSDVDIEITYVTYDQYDVDSFKLESGKVFEIKPDGVIIGPTFLQDTVEFCKRLDETRIPFIFIDTVIPGTNPIAHFSANQEQCGRLLGQLLDLTTDNDSEIAIFSSKRAGSESYNSISRKKALIEEISERKHLNRIKETEFSIHDDSFEKDIIEYLSNNSKIRSIAILNSRGSLIARLLKKNGINNVHIGCFDLTSNNKECLQDESISFVIYQNPEKQAFEALKSMIAYLIFGKIPYTVESTPRVEAIFKENCP
ncbi:MAG: LacI family DNA-binding transcriptional regulator [Bacteroidales bacterium]|nr:LacI family DNA-binding transcriptional regulator [Bacteroidales bacterium]